MTTGFPSPPPRYGCATILLAIPILIGLSMVITWTLSEIVAAGFSLDWDPRLLSMQNLAIAVVLSVLQQMFGGGGRS